jgi:hypothetical protein
LREASPLGEDDLNWSLRSRKRFNAFPSESQITLEEDAELKLITARKMAELKRRAEASAAAKQETPNKTVSNKEVVLSMLYDRGDEVLEAALERYPRETSQIIDELAKMIREKKFVEKVSGGDLLSTFRQIGMRISLRNTIRIEEHGKFIDLAEKFRKNE